MPLIHDNPIEHIVGFSLRIQPPSVATEAGLLSWESICGDIDFWPNVKDRRCAPFNKPTLELWERIDQAKSCLGYDSGVVVALTLPIYPGCHLDSGCANFIEYFANTTDVEKISNQWFQSGREKATLQSLWSFLGYDVFYAGALKSILLQVSSEGRWEIVGEGKRTKYGLFEHFSDALLNAAALREIGRMEGWAAEETNLWPIGVWLAS